MSPTPATWLNTQVIDNLSYQKRKVKITLTALVIAIILGFFILFLLTPAATAENFDETAATELISLTNQQRLNYQLSTLSYSSSLSQAAKNKAADLFKKQYFSHNSPDGKKFSDWVKEAEYAYMVVGENLAIGFGNNQAIINAWMNSSTHRANILLARYQEIGLAVARGKFKGEEITIVVQYFGTPKNTKISEIFMPNGKLTGKELLFKI